MRAMWEKRYSGNEYAYESTPNRYFRDKLNTLPAGKVLLICEGEGRNAVYAAFRGWRSVAMDYSEKGKLKAMKLAEMKGVPLEYHVSPVESFEFPSEDFDAVGLIFAHFEPILRTYVHAQVRKALKKGGKLIFEAFSKEQAGRDSGGPVDINTLYAIEDLRNDFAGFTFMECNEMETLLNEGLFHIGMANVIRIFATKL
jgi:SAM-dependent methyltransferase